MKQILFRIPLPQAAQSLGLPSSIPIYGYGTMLFVGFLMATWLARRRASREGLDPRRVEDTALAVLFGGIVGARLFFVVEYSELFILPPMALTLSALTAAAGVVAVILVPLWYVGHRKLRMLPLCILSGAIGILGWQTLWGVVQTGGSALLQGWPVKIALLGAVAVLVLRSGNRRRAAAAALASAMAMALAFAALEGINHWSEGRLRQSFIRIINLQAGGLVWYGGVMGGVLAFMIGIRRWKLPALKVCDLLVPSVMLGLAFGRIGCLLNGCCWGDVTSLPWAIHFPPGSQPFQWQTEHLGLSPTAHYSLGVHPTQLYSTLNALILFVLLSAYLPLRRRDGQVAALAATLYPVTRFLLEFLRNDEPAQWGTGLTIAQNLSVLFFVAGLMWLLWLHQNGRIQKTEFRNQNSGF